MYFLTGALAFFANVPSRLDAGSLSLLRYVTITKPKRYAAQFFAKLSRFVGQRDIAGQGVAG
jgi:hypothetical protein